MNNIRVPKSRIVEAVCRTDFLSHFQSCFAILEPGSTLNLNWHHYTMAHYFELVMNGSINLLIIVAPPRTLKSLMASVAFPTYVLGRDPTKRVVGISYGADLQIGFSNYCRRIIESPRYQKCFPRVQLSKNTETEFHTTLGGYRYARSAEGSLTGIGGDILILDDFQKPTDMVSDARRFATNSLYYNTVASRINNQHKGAIIVICQRLHIDDLVGMLLRSEENWTVVILPAIAEKEEEVLIGPGQTHLRRVGDLLHPENMSREFLEALRCQDPETFAAQWQQSPIPPGGFMIKREQIQYCDELPSRTSSSLYIQSWDPGLKPGKQNSRSACLDILVQDNRYFITHALAGQWVYPDLMQHVLSRATEQKPNVILIEDAGLGTPLIDDLKQKGPPVVAVKPEGDKVTRLLRHMSKFANRQVFLLKSAPGRTDLETELFTFPGGQRDDLVDALTQALNHKHTPYLWTPKASENYGNMLMQLMLSGVRF